MAQNVPLTRKYYIIEQVKNQQKTEKSWRAQQDSLALLRGIR